MACTRPRTNEFGALTSAALRCLTSRGRSLPTHEGTNGTTIRARGIRADDCWDGDVGGGRRGVGETPGTRRARGAQRRGKRRRDGEEGAAAPGHRARRRVGESEGRGDRRVRVAELPLRQESQRW